MEKSNQLPKTEGCLAEGKPVELGSYRVERPSRSVPRETREPQAGPASCLSHSASKVPDASGDTFIPVEPRTETAAPGEAVEGLPGSQSVARAEGDTRNERGPEGPCRTNCEAKQEGKRNDKERFLAIRESDRLIVSSSHPESSGPKLEKGPTDQRSPHRPPAP